MYVSGSSADSAIALSATTAPSTSTPSQAPRPGDHSGRGWAQARASGMITSEPDASARNQLRQNVGISEDSTVPPARSEIVATVAVTARAGRDRDEHPTDLLEPVQRRPRARAAVAAAAR